MIKWAFCKHQHDTRDMVYKTSIIYLSKYYIYSRFSDIVIKYQKICMQDKILLLNINKFNYRIEYLTCMWVEDFLVLNMLNVHLYHDLLI